MRIARTKTKDLSRGMRGLSLGLALIAPSLACAQNAPPPSSLNPLRALQKADLKGFLEQPLFDPSRHLAPPPLVISRVVEVPRPFVPEAPPPSLHLLGIIQGKDDIAVVRRDNNGKTIMLSTGDKIDNWSVIVLPSLGIQLRDGARVFDYALFGPASVPRGSVSTDPPANP